MIFYRKSINNPITTNDIPAVKHFTCCFSHSFIFFVAFFIFIFLVFGIEKFYSLSTNGIRRVNILDCFRFLVHDIMDETLMIYTYSKQCAKIVENLSFLHNTEILSHLFSLVSVMPFLMSYVYSVDNKNFRITNIQKK